MGHHGIAFQSVEHDAHAVRASAAEQGSVQLDDRRRIRLVRTW